MNQPAPHRRAQALLVLAAVAYCGLLWEAALGYPVSPSSSYLSELAAADQPWRWVFRAGDLVAGSAALTAALLLLRSLRIAARRAVVGRLTLAALAVFGSATVLDALLPLRCSPSTDAACAAADAAGTLGFAHEAHSVTSTVAVSAAVVLAVGLVALGWRARRSIGAGIVPMVAGTVALAATLALSVLSLRAELAGGSPPGIVQRAQTLSFSLVLLGLGLAWRGRPPGTSAEP